MNMNKTLCTVLVTLLVTVRMPLVNLYCQPFQSGLPQHLVQANLGKRQPDLVELVRLDSSIKLDIRYATAHNFVGKAVYAQARAFLQRPAAEALVRVHRKLRARGYGILVFDGYRPWSVTNVFWKAVSPAQRKFVANPQSGSVHNRGCAVDVSLFDLKTGKEIPMPSEYDALDERAALDYNGGTAEQRAMRSLLQTVMHAEGFRGVRHEWWHFDFQDWREYPVLNVDFADIPIKP
jgi:D-alanyl-D-alanine dipeptidase